MPCLPARLKVQEKKDIKIFTLKQISVPIPCLTLWILDQALVTLVTVRGSGALAAGSCTHLHPYHTHALPTASHIHTTHVHPTHNTHTTLPTHHTLTSTHTPHRPSTHIHHPQAPPLHCSHDHTRVHTRASMCACILVPPLLTLLLWGCLARAAGDLPTPFLLREKKLVFAEQLRGEIKKQI